MASEPASPARARRSASRVLRFAGIALAIVVLLAAATALFMSSRYFGATVEAGLAKAMLDGKQRTLKFEGPLEVSFWPNVGFKIGRVSLSEPGGAQEFASLDAARFSVAVAPLFGGRIDVTDCAVEGLQATIVRHRDGTLNIADLLPAETQPSSAAFTVDVGSAKIARAKLTWIDEAQGSTTALSELELSGERLRADTAAKTLQADAVSLGATVGDARLHLGIAGLSTSPAGLAAERLGVEATARGGDLAVEVALDSRLTVDATRRVAALENLTGSVKVTHPRLPRRLEAQLQGALHAGAEAADGALSAHFDESTARLKLRLTRYAPPVLAFDLDIDRLDMARYLPDGEGDAAQPSSAATTTDLSSLGDVTIDGTANIGSLKIAGMETRNIRFEIRSTQGRLDIRGGERPKRK
jgi:AsmA protein